jgi:hypothetical protein
MLYFYQEVLMDKNGNFTLFNAILFSAAFGFLEATVVVYLREL